MMMSPPPLGTLSQGTNSLLVGMLTRYHLACSPGIICYAHQVPFGMFTRYHLLCSPGTIWYAHQIPFGMLTRYHLVCSPGIIWYHLLCSPGTIWYAHQVPFGMLTRYQFGMFIWYGFEHTQMKTTLGTIECYQQGRGIPLLL